MLTHSAFTIFSSDQTKSIINTSIYIITPIKCFEHQKSSAVNSDELIGKDETGFDTTARYRKCNYQDVCANSICRRLNSDTTGNDKSDIFLSIKNQNEQNQYINITELHISPKNFKSPDLKYLEIRNNSLQNAKYVVKPFRELITLDLSFNPLNYTTLPNALRDIHKLEKLVLQGYSISQYNKDVIFDFDDYIVTIGLQSQVKMDLHRWMYLLFKAGIAIFLVITICDAGSKQPRRTPAHKLAQQTGAAHYEERYEKVLPTNRRSHRLRKRASDEDVDYEVYQGVVGRPGIDFPILPRIPQTTFSCRTFGNGYFADLETDCQVFHICEEGRKISFLCPNGTIFQQSELTCDWWFKVNCASSPGHYAESSEMLIRAQNRNKQKNPQTKNEFYSSESDYSRERVNHKNSYPVKSSKGNNGRRRNQNSNSNSKRFESEEIPSVESVDFEDISSNSASQEQGSHQYGNTGSGSASYERKPKNNNSERKATERRRVSENRNDKIVSRYDSSDEMQEPAESTFFGSGNRNNANSNSHHNDVKDNGYIYGKPNDNGYIYDNPNKTRKQNDREGKQRSGNGRNQNKYESDNKRTSKNRATTPTPSEKNRFTSKTTNRQPEPVKQKQEKAFVASNSVINKSDKRTTTPTPNNLVKDISYRNSETGKIETTKQTPFYTPTIPAIVSKSTTKSYNQKSNKVTTEKYSFTATTTRKPPVSYNVFNLPSKTTTDQPFSTEINTEYTSTPRNNLVIGLRNTHKTDPSTVNQVFTDSNKSGQRNSKGRVFTTTEYPEATTFYGPRSNLQKFTTTTEDISKESSTSGPTYLPREITTFRPSPSSTTYFPTTTRRPSSAGPTYLPKQTTTPRVSTKGATYLPTISYTTSTNGPTYLPKETTTFRTSSAGPTYLPKEKVTTYRPLSSSSGPTYLPTTTLRPSTNGATYLPTPASKIDDSVSDHVKDMIRTLNELKNDLNVDTKALNEDANKYLDKPPRPGLEIPPSSGPETLVSLASYFAGEELANVSLASRSSSTEPVNVKQNANINAGLLSNRTVSNYENLFGLAKTTEPTYLPDILSPEFKTRDSNDLEAQHTSGLLGDAIGKPETRKIAQVFTNALSAYLEDPDSFRQVLSEVRPTEPPIHLEADGAPASYRKPSATKKPEFKHGTGATYLPKPTTTSIAPPTATTNNDELEVLDFSDVSLNNKNRAKLKPTTEYNLGGRITSNAVKNKPVSRFSFGLENSEEKLNKKLTTTTEANDIAVEINKELKLSTTRPIPLSFDLIAPEINTASTTNQPEISTTLSDNLLFPVGPKGGKGKASIPSLSAELLPPGISEDDEDMLQRAQSQSFISSRNELTKNIKSDRTGKLTKNNLHSEPLINRDRTSSARNRIITTTIKSPVEKPTESPWTKITQSVYLDPLTINDGLMEKFRTTTASPFTYLPKKPTILSRTSKTFSELSDLSSELLPPTDGMQKIAIQMFGGLNETAATHLMNVMKKAESNSMARRLILLLIQTCDEDYSKTVEQSRKALLNALIGMDNEYTFDDEVEVIKLKPRRQKSVNVSNRSANLIQTTTNRIPVTTYRRSVESSTPFNKLFTTSTILPPTTSTTDSNIFTTSTIKPSEETTRFEIRVADPDELTTTTTYSPIETKTTSTILPETSTVFGKRRTTTQTIYTTTDSPVITTTIKNNSRGTRVQYRINAVGSTVSPSINDQKTRQASKRKAKDIESSLGNTSDLNSHKNSDERALELLKSLYSLASKFGRR
ncbi:mucin-2 [Condylostylus longicornis]|uniref:mucin-2 n=1 Tax=Condylostylus longicornis TaxID=2530218 RepID=UPI00244E428E|nr:mucin-2 [Condylostylus longicornis]